MHTKKAIEWQLENNELFYKNEPDKYTKGWVDALKWMLSDYVNMLQCRCGREQELLMIGDAGYFDCECGLRYLTADSIVVWERNGKEESLSSYESSKEGREATKPQGGAR